MLRRKKNITKEPEEGSKLVEHICQRPFGSYRPIDYIPYAPFYNELYPKLDSWMEELFKGNLDDGNGDMLDSLILDHVRLALDNLSEQYIKHIDTAKAIANRLITDPQCFEDQIALTEETLEGLKERYNDISERYNNIKWR